MHHRVLITGANGLLGKVLRVGLKGVYPVLRLTHRRELDESPAEGEEFAMAALEDPAAVEAAMRDVDAVVHLGARADEDDWEVILEANIAGTYNVFEAARRAGAKRVVFGSSHHVVGFHRRDRVLGPDAPPRPDSRYGVSKAFGEALGRLYADKYGLSVVSLRIGVARPCPIHSRSLWTWLGDEDWVRLVRAALDAPADLHYEVVYGVSANARNPYDNPGGARIGYAPRQNAEDYVDEVYRIQRPEEEPEAERPFHGGQLCAREFAGDLDKID
jgi:uronate dehydrogenase